MAMLGFPSSQAFEHTTLEDIEQAFMHRVYEIEVNRAMGKKDKGEGRKTELRKLNEALQYLIRKRRRLSGRSMQSNWQLGSSKSNEANQVIQVFQKSSGQGLMAQLRAKKAEEDRSEVERKASQLHPQLHSCPGHPPRPPQSSSADRAHEKCWMRQTSF